jgi:tungstate transport system substrate-binding protein
MVLNMQLPRLFKYTAVLTYALLPFSAIAADVESSKTLRLATTTSTENSGLLQNLLPYFERKTGYTVHVIAVGTGKALRMGRDGDVDVVLVHAPAAEQKFVDEGAGVKRVKVMYNDFVIVGPADDPASVSSSTSGIDALSKIAKSQAIFISRGDDSGTNKKELSLWKKAGIKPQGDWYREAGQGMGKVLQMSGELAAYTLTDRGTWLAYQTKSPLKITYEGDPILFNPYGIIAVNPARYPDINSAGAQALIDWITSPDGQRMIGSYTVAGSLLFTPSADTGHVAQEKAPAGAAY